MSTKFVTNFVRIYITKFGDSRKSSLNLVTDFAQYFPLVLFLKKITKMVTIFVTKFGEKNRTLLIYFRFSKKNHQNSHDNCHQIWWFTKPITKFGEENRTFLITIHPSGPSSLLLGFEFASTEFLHSNHSNHRHLQNSD